ncbi:hypothetical protein [Salipiger bermudensis]|uniref:hypothetical protein n=1 Tax=Salipiger bermudensis TaxID=344736 RepID=UPI001CD58476|nr:hypothetical protein [Salipiger bermudensis]MCA0963265.1 hypothetical protein [Salipiger bermudensis]
MERVSQTEFAKRVGVCSSVFSKRCLGEEVLSALGRDKGGSSIARGSNAKITYPESTVAAVEGMVQQGMAPVFAMKAYAYRREIISSLGSDDLIFKINSGQVSVREARSAIGLTAVSAV